MTSTYPLLALKTSEEEGLFLSATELMGKNIHRLAVGDSLELKNDFFPYPPFQKYKYEILSKQGMVTEYKTSLGNGLEKTVTSENIKFKFNFPGTAFINIKNCIRSSSEPFSVIVEVSSNEDI